MPKNAPSEHTFYVWVALGHRYIILAVGGFDIHPCPRRPSGP